MNVVLQSCFCITGQSREKLSDYVLVLNLLVSLELTETRVEVIQEDQQRGGITKVSAEELKGGEGGGGEGREGRERERIVTQLRSVKKNGCDFLISNKYSAPRVHTINKPAP